MPSKSDEETTALVAPTAKGDAGHVSFVLRVATGLDSGLALLVGNESSPRKYVGKGPTSDLKLRDPQVSRRHLAVEVEGRALRVTDAGSSNGTSLNGVRVMDAFACDRDRLRIGQTELVVEGSEGRPEHPAPETSSFSRVIGKSAVMRHLYPLCGLLSASTIPLLIEGETGTGKEALAEAIHESGPRANGPFLVFDCTAVPANLVESELFGHESGAFTGASAQRKGLFELASGGTLLIDEIGDLEPSMQPKLLRVVERGEVRRLGGSKTLKCDVRILAATRRDLEREVQAGRFRDDLFHRLAVGRVELPPLRKRTGDVPLLAAHFWRQLGGRGEVPPDALARWETMQWPGNVRELRNAVARRIALGDLEGRQRAIDVSAANGSRAGGEIGHVLSLGLSFPIARDTLLREFEARYVAHALDAAGGNVSKAATASGIARRYFQLVRERTKG